jgi:hypothetical protein
MILYAAAILIPPLALIFLSKHKARKKAHPVRAIGMTYASLSESMKMRKTSVYCVGVKVLWRFVAPTAMTT